MGKEADSYLLSPTSKWMHSEIPYPPLGVAYLSSAGKEIDISSQIIDGQFTKNLSRHVLETALSYKPILVGISSTLLQLPDAVKTAREIKVAKSASIVVFGGTGPNCLPPDELYKYAGDCIDAVGIQEGEFTWQDILKKYAGSLDKDGELFNPAYLFKDVAGLLINTGDEFVSTAPRPLVRNLDTLPMPDLEGIDAKKYIETWRTNGGMGSISLLPSRGCPFGCIFCSKTISGRVFRHHSPERIVDEMERITHGFGFDSSQDEIFLFDDNLSTKRKVMIEVCESLIRRRLKVNWSCQARVNTVDAEMLSLMAAAGCREIYYGVEAVTPNLLKFLGKGITADQAAEAIQISRSVGMKPGIFLIVGIPGEKKRDIEAMANFIRGTKPAYVGFSTLIPFPGTELYERTSHLIRPELRQQYGVWDDTRYSVYQSGVFEMDPQQSIAYLNNVFKETLATYEVDHNPSQFVLTRYDK